MFTVEPLLSGLSATYCCPYLYIIYIQFLDDKTSFLINCYSMYYNNDVMSNSCEKKLIITEHIATHTNLNVFYVYSSTLLIILI